MRIIDWHIDSLHVGHKTGLYYNDPKNFEHTASPAQRWLWKTWEIMQDDFKKLLDIHKPDQIHITFLGEIGDIDFHKRYRNLYWSHDKEIVRLNAIEVINPLVQLADAIHFCRGTSAHVGEGGSLDDMIARSCDKTIAPKNGLAESWDAVEYELAGVLFDCAHHGKNKSKWANENMINALRTEIILERTKNNRPVPDVVSRGHYHWYGATDRFVRPLVVQVPSMQLPYEFIYRIDPVVRTPMVGSVAFICEDGKAEHIPLLYTYPRSKPWRMQKK